MSVATPNVVCRDPARALVYENLSSYYEGEDEGGKVKLGTCSICGAADVPLVDLKNSFCAAQKALTRKGHLTEEGHEPAFGAPKKDADRRGYNAILDQKATFLVLEDGAVFPRRIVPTRPTPDSLRIVPGVRFEDLLDQVMTTPRTPYVIGQFGRKADMRMTVSTNEDEIVVNGTEPPVRLDRTRLATLVSIIEEFGPDLFDSACKARALSQIDKVTARREQDRIADAAPALLERIKEIPNGVEPESEYAKRIARNRKFRAAPAAEQTETQTEEAKEDAA